MFEKQVQNLAAILKDKDLRTYTGDAFWNLIQAVISQDAFAGLSSIQNVKDLIFHIPTVVFWEKMRRFLYGTYRNFEEQVKMAARFEGENENYIEFVKKQIYLIDEMDDDSKIDYYASLTRCFLLSELDSALYFKLAKYLVQCTSYELDYMKKCDHTNKFDNSAIISMLYQYGLFEQEVNSNTSGILYKLSGFGRALKYCSLNFNDGNIDMSYLSYTSLSPLAIPEPPTIHNIQGIFDGGNNLILNGGRA